MPKASAWGHFWTFSGVIGGFVLGGWLNLLSIPSGVGFGSGGWTEVAALAFHSIGVEIWLRAMDSILSLFVVLYIENYLVPELMEGLPVVFGFSFHRC